MRPTLSFFNIGFSRGKIVSRFSSIVWYHNCGYSYFVGDFVAGFSNVRNYSSQVLFDSTSERLVTEPEVYNRPSTSDSSYYNTAEFSANNIGSSPQLSAPQHWCENWQGERVDMDSNSARLVTEPEVYDHPSTSYPSYYNTAEFTANNIGSSPQLSAPRHWCENWQGERVDMDSNSARLVTEPEVYDHPSTSYPSYYNTAEFTANNIGSSPQLSAPRHWLKNWQEERVDKLTASTFSQAIGFFSHRRVQLWLEKLGAIEPFPARRSYPGYYAALWSISNEKKALDTYKYISGNDVSFPAFQVYGEDQWLGASPDGMIYSDYFHSPGVLEIKCPYFRGDKREASPWKRVPVYYIPQAQGLMEILNLEWMELFVWTLNGSSLFRIYRNKKYWKLLSKALSDFWWGHVMPAKLFIDEYVITDPLTQLKPLKPTPKHYLWKDLLVESRKISDQSKLLVCTPK